MNFFEEGITRVVGHRGSPLRALENSVESFDCAEAEGADGCEMDVRLTLDGEAVVFHDAEILVSGRRVPVASLTIPEILDVPVLKGEFRGHVSTLRDVLMRYGRDGRWLVELKAGPSPRPGLLEHRVAAVLSELALAERCVILSFSPDMLRRVKEIEPRLSTCLNFDAASYRPTGRFWPDLPKGCAGIGPNVALATARLMAEAKEAGLFVHVWTVDDPETARHLTTWGAASVITDDVPLIGSAVRAVTASRPPLQILPT